MRKLNTLRPQPESSVRVHTLAAVNHLAMLLGLSSAPAYHTADMRRETRRAIRELHGVLAALA